MNKCKSFVHILAQRPHTICANFYKFVLTIYYPCTSCCCCCRRGTTTWRTSRPRTGPRRPWSTSSPSSSTSGCFPGLQTIQVEQISLSRQPKVLLKDIQGSIKDHYRRIFFTVVVGKSKLSLMAFFLQNWG